MIALLAAAWRAFKLFLEFRAFCAQLRDMADHIRRHRREETP